MKKLLVALVMVVALLGAGVAMLPRLVPVAALQARLAGAVKAATGRELGIAGGIRFALFPHLGVQADDVTLANVAGGKAVDMLRLKSLELQLRLMPLLHGSIEVGRFVLRGPVIALERDAEGRGNWEFAAAASGRAAPPAPASPPPAGRPFGGLALDDIRLVDGTISYLDRRTGAAWQAEGLDFALALPGPGRPFTAGGHGTWNGQAVAANLSVGDPFGLAAGGQSDVALKLISPTANVVLDGHAAGGAANRIEGKVDISVPSLRDLLARLGAGQAMGGTATGAVSLKAAVAVAGVKLSLDDVVATLDGTTVKGAVALDGSGARPAITAKLVVDRIDLASYSTPAPAAAGPAVAAAGKPAGWSDAPIDLSGLRAVDGELDLTCGPVSAGAVRLDRLAATARLKDGKLAADIAEVALYGGKGQGKIAVDAAAAVPAFDVRFGVGQVQLGPLLVAFAGVDRLSGTANADIAVTASGGSERAIVGALGGSGKLGIANGRIAGVDLLAMARSAAARVAGGGAIRDFTEIGSLTASFNITKGVLHNTDLAMRSGSVTVNGGGDVDLLVRRIDFTLRPQLPGGVSVPLRVSGPWDGVAVAPDVAALLADPGQAVGDLRKVVPGGTAGTLLKGILGR
jgi:AsmA protein